MAPVIDPGLASRGYALHHLTEVGSTNTEAKCALRQGQSLFWVVADQQIAGRGRHDRSWVSPPGNLYASLALAHPAAPAQLPLLGFVAGLALVEAIKSLAPDLAPRLTLKWPNDMLLDGKKCAGILLEGADDAQGRRGVVIGIGVNIAHGPQELKPPVAWLASAAPWVDRDMLFSALQLNLAALLRLFDEGRGFGFIRQLWLASAIPLGQRLGVKLPGGPQSGTFAGMDADGGLLLDVDGKQICIVAGDVHLIGD
ncbi:BirA Biotin-(acetyl-CoA carboxylase) ligase [Rhabdaerophilaceae bacterium]